MLYNILPIIGIFLGIIVIIIILIRKFPQTSLINVESLPQEQQAKVKKILLERKLRDNLIKTTGRVVVFLRPHLAIIGNKTKIVWGWVKAKEQKYAKEVLQRLHEAEKVAMEENLSDSGEATPVDAQLSEEQQYLERIKINPKDLDAYKGLAGIYFDNKQYNEARESWQFILRLNPQDDDSWSSLGELEELEENFNEAKIDYEKALEIAPNHPKFLDQFIELAIKLKDKRLASRYFKKLKSVNPANQKLVEFSEKIEQL